MTEYLARKVKETSHQNIFQIAKFDGYREPSEIYTVTETKSNGWFHCNCMGFRRSQTQEHKHILIAIQCAEFGHNLFNENLQGSDLY